MTQSIHLSPFWSETSERVRLRENEIHVWLVNVDDGNLCIRCGANLLSSDEQDRGARYKFQKDRRRYIIAHAALRLLLSQYASVASRDLTFFTGTKGKPFLAATGAAGNIQFNLSHSREVALLAVTRGREIGVDVEYVDETFAFGEIAERFFSQKEASMLRALPSELQRRTFYRCWTSKEAFLKAKGTGLSGELDEVEIVLNSEGDVSVNGTIRNWTLIELNPRDGYVGALAVEGKAPCGIKCFRWQQQLANESAHRHH